MLLSIPLLFCALLIVGSAPGASARPIDAPPFGLPDGGGRPFDFETPVVDAPPFGLPDGGGRPFDFGTPVALSIESLAATTATTPVADAGGLAQVPEPASAILLGLGVAALALCRRALGAPC